MKHLKLILAVLLVIVSSSQLFIYGLHDYIIVWLLYSLSYLVFGLYQKFHASSVRSQVFTLVYVAVPLIFAIAYCALGGASQLTEAFYIIFTIALALTLIWEIVSLCLVIAEKSDEKKDKH